MALVVRGISKRFGSHTALQDLSFTAGPGITALLGANGSGKSTLLRVLATLVTPDSGDVSFGNFDYPRFKQRLRGQIGYLPQHMLMPESLTVGYTLKHLASLRGGNAAAIIEQLQIQALADKHFSELSSGQARLVGIAQAFLGMPRMLLLDEPSSGMDVIQREHIFRLISSFEGVTLFSTHVPEDIERIEANQIIMLDHGSMLFCGSVQELLATAKGYVHELTCPPSDVTMIEEAYPVTRVTHEGECARVRVISALPPPEGIPVQPTIEDAYLSVMTSLKSAPLSVGD